MEETHVSTHSGYLEFHLRQNGPQVNVSVFTPKDETMIYDYASPDKVETFPDFAQAWTWVGQETQR